MGASVFPECKTSDTCTMTGCDQGVEQRQGVRGRRADTVRRADGNAIECGNAWGVAEPWKGLLRPRVPSQPSTSRVSDLIHGSPWWNLNIHTCARMCTHLHTQNVHAPIHTCAHTCTQRHVHAHPRTHLSSEVVPRIWTDPLCFHPLPPPTMALPRALKLPGKDIRQREENVGEESP